MFDHEIGSIRGETKKRWVEVGRAWDTGYPPPLSELQRKLEKDMHERKQHMSSLADAFIAMPGGFGTLEELFEMITWKQLGFHSKPVGILNVDGFYDALLKFLDESVSLGFISKSARELLFVAESPDELLNKLSSFSSE